MRLVQWQQDNEQQSTIISSRVINHIVLTELLWFFHLGGLIRSVNHEKSPTCHCETLRFCVCCILGVSHQKPLSWKIIEWRNNLEKCLGLGDITRTQLTFLPNGDFSSIHVLPSVSKTCPERRSRDVTRCTHPSDVPLPIWDIYPLDSHL